MDNTVTVIGNVTRDVELKFTPSGAGVAEFGIAVNRRWQNRQTQEWEEQVSFFDIKAWQQLGENAADSINKGDRVVVTGRLEQRTWETDNGEKRSKVEIVADDVAVSVRWAIVRQLEKNEKRSEGGNSSSGRGSNGGGRQAPAARQAPEPAAYDGEEPF